MSVSGWPSFTLWGLVGVLYAFACLAMMSIGVFILLIAILATIAAARSLNAWPDIIGLAPGAATVFAWIGFRTWPLPDCGPGEQPGIALSASAASSFQSGRFTRTERIAECASLDAALLTCTAIVLLAAALIAYAVISRRTRAGENIRQ
jgi:hypothetical protein